MAGHRWQLAICNCHGPVTTRRTRLGTHIRRPLHTLASGDRMPVGMAHYRTTLPEEQTIAAELERTRAALENRASSPREPPRKKRRAATSDRER